MSFLSFFGLSKKAKIIAVLDISSSSIGGMLIRRGNGLKKPEIISRVRTAVNFLLDVDFDAFWRCTLGSLKKTMEEMLKDYPSGPDACLCVFSSPWFVSQTKKVKIERDKPFKVTKEFLDELISDEEKRFKENYALRKDKVSGEPALIDREIIKAEINGYYTKKPLDKWGKDVLAHIYVSLGIKKIKEEISQEILKNFGDAPTTFMTFPLLVFKVFKGVVDTQKGFTLVDIGGEITDISVIKNDCLEETASFARGKNLLLRKIANELKITPREAISFLQVFLNNHSTPKNQEKFNDLIKEAKEEWSRLFEQVAEGISKNNPLPQTIFLLGDEIVSNVFISCVSEKNFAKYALMGEPFKIGKIMPESLLHRFAPKVSNKRVKNENAENLSDAPLMIEALFANDNIS